MKLISKLLLLTAAFFLAAGCGRSPDGAGAKGAKTVLRVGYFPNITHAQGVIASELTRQGKGWFEERLGPDVEIQWFTYNAGPSAMEAIFANSIDLTYVGPNPVLNAYSKSKGEEVRIVAGAATGGAALVVPGDGRLAKPEDFRGKRLATPQLGNTQDVAARVWLGKQGYKITQLGGDVQVLPTANPDQLALFQSGGLDAVWTVEPWVSRLELEAGGKVFLEQDDALTTVLASSVKALKEKRELVAKFAKAHAELTAWINAHPAEAQELVRQGIRQATRNDLPPQLAAKAWPRLKFSSEVTREPLVTLVAEAQSVGFLKGAPDLGPLIAPLP
jgi:NitT/TauT family transport system substrate-binding protein